MGKSTLADRFLEITGALQAREMEAQVLDAMDLERERGITIKAHPVCLHYTATTARSTSSTSSTRRARRLLVRGHALARRLRRARCCSSTRRRASRRRRWPTPTSRSRTTSRSSRSSTRSTCERAAGRGARQITDIIGLDGDHAILASAKVGTGVVEVLEAIVHRLPPPAGDTEAPLKALIFDSWYDAYRGVVIVVRVIDGVLRPG
jgi:GTP-binding protein LepA